MEATLKALGDILIKALPTLFLVLLLHFYLKRMFFKPLEKVLHARYEATEGARKQADLSLDKARVKSAEFEEALRAARSEIWREQEETRRKQRQEQLAAVTQARDKVSQMVKEAQQQIAAEASTTRQNLIAESEALADQIVKGIVEGRAR
jgi:F-type H+-transporting ATPase subunit b